MTLDEIDMKILYENFCEDMIKKIDTDNISKILKYLNDNGIYYYKDLFLTFLDLFLLDSTSFINKFEKIKLYLGSDYIEKIGEDISLMERMYQD